MWGIIGFKLKNGYLIRKEQTKLNILSIHDMINFEKEKCLYLIFFIHCKNAVNG